MKISHVYTMIVAIPLLGAGCDAPEDNEEQEAVEVEPEPAEVTRPDGPDTVRAREVDPESGLLCILCILGGNELACGDNGESYANACFARCDGAEVVDAGSYYPDADGDGFGDADATPVAACVAPAGTVDNGQDCDDGEQDVYPGQPELCDGLDNDCDGDAACAPESCADVAADDADAADGEYTLYVAGDVERPWTAYCVDLAGEARVYLSLVAVGGGRNFSQYTAGGASPGTTVRTDFTRVRIDPVTLVVDIDDQSFASSTGQLFHSGNETVTAMPFGVAESCGGVAGVGNVDLTGTSFRLADPFCTAGSGAYGGVTFSANDQVADLVGGGGCGWTSPACTYNPNDLLNGSVLELAYVGP